MSSLSTSARSVTTRREPLLNYQQTKFLWMIVRVVILVIACIFALFPVVWIASAAFNPSQSVNTQKLIPELVPPLEARSPVTGTVVAIYRANGDRVDRAASRIVAIESNGQRRDILAPKDGYIEGLNLEVGQTVNADDVLFAVGSSYFINFDVLFNTPRYPFARWVLNSVVIASINSILAVLITALSAYSFSRFRFRGRQALLVTILLVQVFPNLLALVAIFLMLQQIGTYIPFLGLNTMGGLILVYLGGAMGINIWLMKGFFDSIPRDIDESALVDGANHWQTYWLLIFPLVRPILIVVGILSFVGTFNEFVLARVMIRDPQYFTLMVGLWQFVADTFGQNWGIFAAGSLIGALPTLIIYLLLQDQIVGGLTQGAVKG